MAFWLHRAENVFEAVVLVPRQMHAKNPGEVEAKTSRVHDAQRRSVDSVSRFDLTYSSPRDGLAYRNTWGDQTTHSATDNSPGLVHHYFVDRQGLIDVALDTMYLVVHEIGTELVNALARGDRVEDLVDTGTRRLFRNVHQHRHSLESTDLEGLMAEFAASRERGHC